MEKLLVVILDPAHGSDVAGKCSPDKTHYEWKWSREICKKLEGKLLALGYKVFWTSTSDKEIGLSKRKKVADSIKTTGKEVKFLLSLHNNAVGMGDKWYDASGVSIWTSKGKTLSDYFADLLFEAFMEYFPKDQIKYRFSQDKPLERDFEANFTVLMGGSYYACLLEWLFQDSLKDIDKLKDSNMNDTLVDILVRGLEKINEMVISKNR